MPTAHPHPPLLIPPRHHPHPRPTLPRLLARLPRLSLAEARAALLALIDDPDFQRRHVAPLLLAWAGSGGAPSVVRAFGSQSDGTVVQLFLWPPHVETAIHDHACWGAIRVAAGRLTERRYARLDDGAQPTTARLRQRWARTWRPQDGVTTLLPYEGGIHRISNPTDQVAISVHIYGPRLARFDGRDYDPATDSVCDRFEPEH